MALTVRSRFVYPCADLVTEAVAADLALDRASRAVRGDRHGLPVTQADPAKTIVVVGFPRSGNTTLTAWLDRFTHRGITVVDGRMTHSALDVHRCARRGMTVVVPARGPIDTCASMMVRKGEPSSPAYGRQILRAYAAWYRVAAKALRYHTVSVVPFDQIVDDPWQACATEPLSLLVDAERAAGVSVDSFVDDLRAKLAGEAGQGLPQNGVPASMMISLPDQARSRHLEQARRVLRAPELAAELERAAEAFAGFMSRASTRPAPRARARTTADSPLASAGR